MVRRGGRWSSRRSGGGGCGKKDSQHDNYWKVLEGKGSEAIEQVLEDFSLAEFSGSHGKGSSMVPVATASKDFLLHVKVEGKKLRKQLDTLAIKDERTMGSVRDSRNPASVGTSVLADPCSSLYESNGSPGCPISTDEMPCSRAVANRNSQSADSLLVCSCSAGKLMAEAFVDDENMLEDAPAHENTLNGKSDFPNRDLNLLEMSGSEQEPDAARDSALGVRDSVDQMDEVSIDDLNFDSEHLNSDMGGCIQKLHSQVPSYDRSAQVRPPNSAIPCGNVTAVCDVNAGMEVVLGMDIHGTHDPSFRCGNSPIATQLHQKATGSCTQAVCGNASTPMNAEFEQNKVPNAQLSNAFPTQNTPAGSNAWKQRDFIRISPPNKAEILADDGVTINLDMTAVNDNKMKLERALVGRLWGKRIPLYYLNSELCKRWSQFGNFKTLSVSSDCFICVFDCCEARDVVLRGCPWFVCGHLVALDKWTPNFSPHSISGVSSPIWVRLPNLPLLYWDVSNIGRIATMLGEPLWVDGYTSEWGMCSYARVCVRMDLSKKLLSGVWIQGLGSRFFQPVAYEGIAHLCFHCGMIGHKVGHCPSQQAHTGSSPKNVFGTKPQSSPPKENRQLAHTLGSSSKV